MVNIQRSMICNFWQIEQSEDINYHRETLNHSEPSKTFQSEKRSAFRSNRSNTDYWLRFEEYKCHKIPHFL